MAPHNLSISAMGVILLDGPVPENCPKKNIPKLGGCLNILMNAETKNCVNFHALHCTFNTPSTALQTIFSSS